MLYHRIPVPSRLYLLPIENHPVLSPSQNGLSGRQRRPFITREPARRHLRATSVYRPDERWRQPSCCICMGSGKNKCGGSESGRFSLRPGLWLADWPPGIAPVCRRSSSALPTTRGVENRAATKEAVNGLTLVLVSLAGYRISGENLIKRFSRWEPCQCVKTGEVFKFAFTTPKTVNKGKVQTRSFI